MGIRGIRCGVLVRGLCMPDYMKWLHVGLSKVLPPIMRWDVDGQGNRALM